MKNVACQWMGSEGGQAVFPVSVAQGFGERLRGWLGKGRAPEEGLWLEPCASVHGFGMRIPVDVVFVARDGTVLKVVEPMNPWSFCFGGGRVALELQAGKAAQIGIKPGDRLRLMEDTQK